MCEAGGNEETAVLGGVIHVSDRCLLRAAARCALMILWDWLHVCGSSYQEAADPSPALA